ncbi:SAM-dependent methyltransferase [Paenibacillus filicis]|uniref:SAM-dependent methyltransferase n=1 Tax=Paenibacillus filicis TaxID=669464 RepID=A0ABU9DLG7_9BACL
MSQAAGVEGNTELLRRIALRLEQSPDGWLSFRDYMEMCLYEPGCGYYTSEREKLGRTGDFYTSSSLGGLLGECLAHYIDREMNQAEGPLHLVEWGGGSGRLARQVLEALQERNPALYDRLTYTGVETSPYHRRLQNEALQAHGTRIRIIPPEAWKPSSGQGRTLVFSNELPDAFPVHRVVYRPEGWMELGVRRRVVDGQLEEAERPVSGGELEHYITSERLPRREGQRFEAGLDALRWYRSLASKLAPQSLVVTIDYGDVREELHAAHRMNGTLLCYRHHAASDTPLIDAGEQDMTAHVNFSAWMETGERASLSTVTYQTQKQFLVEQGILGLLHDHDARDPFSETAKRNRAIRQLLLSDSMSELFKVLIQIKK